jgi:AraC family transcriptional regulator of arabinose operon
MHGTVGNISNIDLFSDIMSMSREGGVDLEIQVGINRNEVPTVISVGLFETKNHWHHVNRLLSIDTMLYVLDGSVHLCEEGTEYEIKANQTFFLKNGCRHWGHTATPPGTRWYWVSFLPSQPSLEEELLFLPKLAVVSSPEHMIWQLGVMRMLYGSSDPLRGERLNGHLYQLLYELMSQQLSARVDITSNSVAANVMRLLRLQTESAFDGKSIAEALNMNYSYLGRLFKSATGVSIQQYFKRLKVQKAIQLMESGTLNISQISDLLRYPNPYYFSRVFKQVTGFSPRDYQKHLYL